MWLSRERPSRSSQLKTISDTNSRRLALMGVPILPCTTSWKKRMTWTSKGRSLLNRNRERNICEMICWVRSSISPKITTLPLIRSNTSRRREFRKDFVSHISSVLFTTPISKIINCSSWGEKIWEFLKMGKVTGNRSNWTAWWDWPMTIFWWQHQKTMPCSLSKRCTNCLRWAISSLMPKSLRQILPSICRKSECQEINSWTSKTLMWLFAIGSESRLTWRLCSWFQILTPKRRLFCALSTLICKRINRSCGLRKSWRVSWWTMCRSTSGPRSISKSLPLIRSVNCSSRVLKNMWPVAWISNNFTCIRLLTWISTWRFARLSMWWSGRFSNI